ncbi:hypothetical protein HL658_36145 [Azospirillum sp. RWY-5-1]|uniref:Uncharacterized protein n=1 Tax=Azospirillum oleiclasticum TaxID=2735135 RepID=A0ABX2TJ90_9PROT|nr:hypothetical protein [Azospirillum oleiclasticum]NYZ18000.1 hypothetical protein [Azospirillum oleiclasticum]NYZ23406.1 hypothetical protein [Azospirillum oleiclasticum]
MERTADRRPVSRQGALFANHLRTLGPDRFGDWLTASFGGPSPAPALGWFHYDDDALFSDMFAEVAGEFDDAVRDIARDGVVRALRAFDSGAGTYVGLYLLTAVAEALKTVEAVPEVARVLKAWIPARGTATDRIPEDIGPVVALRETLECCFRLMLGATKGESLRTPVRPEAWGGIEPFRSLCNWSLDLLWTRSDLADLKPVWAPVYFFALTAAIRENRTNLLEVLDNRLKGGDRTRADRFESLYEFDSTLMPGLRFAYHLDAILIKAKPLFVAGLTGADVRPAKNTIIRNDDPFECGSLSATSGTALGKEQSGLYLEAVIA